MPSILAVMVVSDENANADARGRASPVVVRVYELRSTDAFDRADFFTLHDKDDSVLGADLLHREEFVLTPGQSRLITRKASIETRAIGVVAAFRAIDSSVWRASAPAAAPVEAGRLFAGRPRQLSFLAQVGRQAISLQAHDLAAGLDGSARLPQLATPIELPSRLWGPQP